MEKKEQKSAEELRREEEEYQRKVMEQFQATLSPEEEEARLEEERRKKREAIMAKYKQKKSDVEDDPTPMEISAPTQRQEGDSVRGFWAGDKIADVRGKDKEASASELEKKEAELKKKLHDQFKNKPAPLPIMRLPPGYREEGEEVQEGKYQLSKSGADDIDSKDIEKQWQEEDEEATKALKPVADMFDENVDADEMGPTKKAVDIDAYVNEDNWDDADGYYNLRVNEILHDRYEVVASRGKGVFSTVVFAKDIKADDNIRAIKLIRSNDVMYRAGQKEIKIAHSLQDDDPHNKMHIIRLLEHFEHKGHLCLVFEPMYMNLREVLRQFGRGVGINVQAVAAYGKQLFTALKHMKAHGIIHCDLKPDNILVNRQKNLVRVCDLGSAMYLTEVEITPYVCSRFYRPPELFTGKIMFQGRSNNHMLKLMQEVKGKIPPRMVKKGLLGETFFDEDGKFLSVEIDPMSKQEVTKRYLYTEKPNKDLKEMLLGDLPKPEGDEMKKLEQLRDFLDRALMMDPGKRLTVEQALSHPFLRGH